MSGMEQWQHLKIPIRDIKKATLHFQKEIGRGGYGSVYEGELSVSGKKMKVAVKKLNANFGQGLKEFLNEIDLLSGKKHENLVTLVGYCDDENEMIIVYEFEERGSLDVYLKFRNTAYTLTWQQRLTIVVDAARGLDHLHNGLEKNHVIIHRDIKSSNILLDVSWVAKISDFGLSKSIFSGLGRSFVISHACGTPGYVEPELKQTGIATKESDVYSFGMVLFEVLCGRLCKRSYDDGIILTAKLAKKYYDNDTLDMIVDPVLRKQMTPNSLRKFSAIAINCLKPRGQRPSMNVVKKELEETLNLEGFLPTPTSSISGLKEQNLQKIPFQKIKDATKNFSKRIGKGPYVDVYEGELFVDGRDTKVAVRKFGRGFEDFVAEIEVLSGIKHENLINLIGYCDDGEKKITVYEFVEHGSLDQYIDARERYTITWLERLKIVVDAAHGLDHLHDHLQKNQFIIQWDVNSSNILLDHKWVAKISNFTPNFSNNEVSNFVEDSYGPCRYLDPGNIQTGSLKIKSDVYSFGIVLFEVLCGNQKRYELPFSGKLVKEFYANNHLDSIIDPILREQMSSTTLRRFSSIAYECLREPEVRPRMDVVKKELEETLKIEVLHWRSFFSRHWYILNVEDLSPESHIVMQEDLSDY